jgi:hypothetical protein
MGLRDDLDAMQRHKGNGTLKQWFEGTAPKLPAEPMPIDTSIGKRGYDWLRERGE